MRFKPLTFSHVLTSLISNKILDYIKIIQILGQYCFGVVVVDYGRTQQVPEKNASSVNMPDVVLDTGSFYPLTLTAKNSEYYKTVLTAFFKSKKRAKTHDTQ